MADIKKVGVLGAGLMGHGIAQVTATAGYDVVLREVDDPTLRHYLRRRGIVALGAVAVLLVCTLAATVSPDVALYGLLLIVPVRVVGNRWAETPSDIQHW